MAKLGADLEASAGRESFTISASTPTRVNPVLGAIADIVKHASYDFVDLRQDMHYYDQDTKNRLNEHDVMLNETLHMAAFGPTPILQADASRLPHFGLGNSLYMPRDTLAKVTPGKLKAFHKKFMVANRMTLGAVGVDHDSFVALAEEMFGSIPQGDAATEASIPTQQTSYVANNLRLYDSHHTDTTSIALAWNAPSLVSNHFAAANVLQAVLGGGASFSAGGPGKGMYSRLYRNILQSQDFVSSLDSFYTAYSDAGLFGINGSVPSGSAADFVDVVLDEMRSLPTSITDEEVNRGKNMLKTQLYTHMSSELELCEEMTRNVQTFGQYQFPTFMKQIDAITTKDVRAIAAMIIDQDITVATHGEASDLPRDIVM
jgi:processing peptidase subunit alpha